MVISLNKWAADALPSNSMWTGVGAESGHFTNIFLQGCKVQLDIC